MPCARARSGQRPAIHPETDLPGLNDTMFARPPIYVRRCDLPELDGSPPRRAGPPRTPNCSWRSSAG